MATFKRSFGSNKVVRADEDLTPAQKRSQDVPTDRGVPAVPNTEAKRQQDAKRADTSSTRPSGVSNELWAEAEASAVGLNGGFAGVGKEGKQRLIREQYDKMVESDKQTKDWAAGSPILGDIGDGNGPSD